MGPLPPAAKPKVETETDKSTGWLVGALASVAALLGAVGIGTGQVARVLSNEPALATTTFTLVAFASVAGAGAGWLTTNQRWEHWLLRLSVVLFLVAIGTALATGIKFAQERPKPAIMVHVSTKHGTSQLRFEVKDSGLRDGDMMTVTVKALVHSHPMTIYKASVGPEASGVIDHIGEVILPPAPANEVEVQASVGEPHSCSDEKKLGGTGCVIIHIPRPLQQPQLTVSWRNPRHSGAGVFIHLSAHSIVDHRAVLRVVDAKTHHQLLATNWPANGTGDIDKAITAIIPGSTRELCVIASTTESRPACPPHAKATNALVLADTPPH